MRNVTRALVVALLASLVAAVVRLNAQTPTAADFTVCNADAQVAVKAGTATPTTKDYVRVESARTDSAAATGTTWVGPIRMGSSDPQLTGMATGGITDAAYQATYRTCIVNGRPSRATRGRPFEASVAAGPDPGHDGCSPPSLCGGGAARAARSELLLGVLGAEALAGDLDEVGTVRQPIERRRGEQ